MASKILIVEDEQTLAAILADYLKHAGFECHLIFSGEEVISWIRKNQTDLVILDLMLPERDGLDIFRELRTFSDVPVMMATAKVDEIDRLLGLELGADDYICKPYSPREVVARVKNVLRRTLKSGVDAQDSVKDKFCIDEKAMIAKFNDQSLPLTPAEFKLLNHLVRLSGKVLSREQLMDNIYSDGRIVTDRTVDSHIKNLRKKIQVIEPDCDCIKSIYGVGYRFEL
ncbi:response regulator [Vibrio marisflavi]|uniref:Transcriptional regulatory protein BaeR n=1 Tax=Vibrio marisflavi CECT 7928 TaxID=634439 RepID=A0ABM8ZZV2_9VIBR|nr:response regulator [Vibrio marisflavi]CAH0536515.1 Transcriptional regulatory protein BaeR [Vibrio marisflavi CECT 7928]